MIAIGARWHTVCCTILLGHKLWVVMGMLLRAKLILQLAFSSFADKCCQEAREDQDDDHQKLR